MKKILYLFCLSVIFYFLIRDPACILGASASGLTLWYSKILPALLPFSIIAYWTIATGAASIAPELFVLVCGLFFGFPMGAKLSADLYEKNIISKNTAQMLAQCTNHMSPAFLCGFVATELALSRSHRILLLCNLYMPSLLVITGYLLLSRTKGKSHKNTASRFELDMQIIDAGIISGCTTLIKLCGYIVCFSIVVGITNTLMINSVLKTILNGLLEVSNGIAYLSHQNLSASIKYILAVAFLSFGGISGLAQTSSMISPCGLSCKKYILAKFILTCIGALIATVIIQLFPL